MLLSTRSGSADSYRKELLLADGAALALTLATPLVGHEISAIAGAAVYAIAPPVIHGVRDDGKRALTSAAVRIGTPAAAVGLGLGLAKLSDCRHAMCVGLAVTAGVVVGTIGAMVIDDFVLSSSSSEPDDSQARTMGLSFSF